MTFYKGYSVGVALSDGINIGVKNAASLIGAILLWILTLWIPYLNIGTTIAMCSLPAKLSKGSVISPLFIFESRYRQNMGDFFLCVAFMTIGLIVALHMLFIPFVVVSISWSLALPVLIDKEVQPTNALHISNRVTRGHKWALFGTNFIINLAGSFLFAISLSLFFVKLAVVGALLMFLVFILLMVVSLGCQAVAYRELVEASLGSD